MSLKDKILSGFDWLAGDNDREERRRKPVPFEWWEYANASTQVLPLVFGPEVPDIPVSDEERIGWAALEALGRDVESGRMTE